MKQEVQGGILAGKVAVVTGGGRGIGRAIAMGYARAGALVVVTARSDTEINAVADEIRLAGGDAMACAADVTCFASTESLFDAAVARFGGVDIVVANAGTASGKSHIETCDPALWRRTFEVNLFGAFHTARAAIPHLRRRGGGKIVMTGSGSRFRPHVGGSAYATSKLALWMLMQTLAMELQDANISVNELIPGPVKTALTGHTRFPEGEWVKEAEDVVPLAIFLATQPGPGPTAQTFSLMRRAG